MAKGYCMKYGDASLGDCDHVEHHAVGCFLTFCVGGSDAMGAGEWTSAFPGRYLEGGKAAGVNLVDQPRVIQQNRGSAGEGNCLGPLMDKGYCKKYGDASLDDCDMRRLTEMYYNHVEHHVVGYFLTFCVGGSDAKGACE